MARTSVVYDLIARDRASRTFQRVGGAGTRLERTVGKAGRAMKTAFVAAGVAAAAGAAASVKMAADFEASMQKINGLVGVSQKQVDGWSKQILALAPTVGKSPRELADAMFFVTSAGFRGKQALDVLEQSARAAAAGLGETQIVADAVTSAMNAYGKRTLSAGKATDILAATVKEGKAEASALAPVIGRLLPMASEMGVRFSDVGAALAALTRTGLNAAEASTAVQAVMKSILKPAEESRKAMDGIGLSYEEVRKTIRERGLFAALMQVRDATDGNQQALAKIFPDVEAFRGVLSLTGSQAKTNAGIFRRMSDSTGVADKAFQSAAKTLKFQWARAVSTMQSWAIRIGTKVLPVVSGFIGFLNRTAVPAIETFARKVANRLTPAFGGIVPSIKKTGKFIGDFLTGLTTTKVGNISKFGKTITTEFIPSTPGEKAGARFRSFMRQLLDPKNIDTGGLGKMLGEALGKAIAFLGKNTAKVSAAVIKALAKVDWVNVGKVVGGNAIGFAIGFVAALGEDLFTAEFWKKHWLDAIIAVLSLAVVGKAIRPLINIFKKIPFAKALVPLLEKVEKFARPFSKAVFGLLAFIGRNFLKGFRKIFPGIGERFGKWLRLLPTRIGVIAIEIADRASRMIAGLARAIIKGAAVVVEAIGKLIARMVKPFARAGSWLLRTGRKLVGGLKDGVVSAMSGIGRWVKSRIVDPIVSAVKRFFGIKSPSRVFMGIGGNMIKGLIKGLARSNGKAIARKIFGDMPSALGAIVNKGLVSFASLPMRLLMKLGGALFGGRGGPGGVKWQMGVLRKVFPGLPLLSGFRPGARTTSGAVSFHARGRAVDLPPSMKVFNWIKANFGKRTKELIFSPAGRGQIHNGRPHMYSGAVRNMHWDHVHWAFDKGGLARGAGLLPKLTPRPERLLSPRQTSAFERLVDVLDRGGGAAGEPQRVVLELRSSGARVDDFLVELLRKAVRVRGGDVQIVLGKA